MMTVTARQYSALVTSAQDYPNCQAYVSDFALSSIWGDPEDAAIPADRLELIESIWTAVHRTPREILAAAGLSQAEFSRRFAVPLRTAENWCGGVSTCPIYLRIAVQQLLGLLTINFA